ncbi:unnamed protein product, partial [Laminaria digitata]
VWAPEEEVQSRAARRAVQTGRVIPPSILRETIDAVPRSVEALAPLADYCVRIDNIGDDQHQHQRQHQHHQHQQQHLEHQHQPQHNVIASVPRAVVTITTAAEAAVATAAAAAAAPQPQPVAEEAESAEAESAAEAAAAALLSHRSRQLENGRGRGRPTRGQEALPLLATVGETWETFRRTFHQETVPKNVPLA